MQTRLDPQNRYTLYLFSFSESAENLPDPEVFLDPTELQHLAKLENPETRKQYLFSRYHLKHLLADKLQCQPSEISFDVIGEGKPVLRNPPFFLDFNMSHSQDGLAVVISTWGYVGVDLEVIRRDRHHLKIAERQFSAEESKVVAAEANAEAQAQLFTRIWSAKEAIIKNAAGGVFKNAHEIRFDVPQWKIEALPASFEAIAKWRLETFEPRPDYICSLALRER